MLVICKDAFAVFMRPKYFPRNDHAQWVVWDTELKKRVYGPSPHQACQRYIDTETFERVPKKS